MSSIQIDHLTKRFGRVVAVDDMILDVADGEFMILLGPTGAGKTTTLRCVAGLERPESGRICFDGAETGQLSPAERDVALVFQNYALYPRKTAFENMAFPLWKRGFSRADAGERVRQIAAVLHIEHLLDRRPAQLSGGEQQRVALGRAMVRQPRAFLMDEPLTNLDFKLRVEMRTELKQIQRTLKTLFFYVTNDQTEAMSMADRIAILNLGVVQQVGTPEDVYDHPRNMFVAGFVGSPRMNFLPCAVSEGMLVGKDDSWRLPIPEIIHSNAGQVSAAGDLILGIRAEDLRPVADGGDTALRGEVYVIEPLGDRTILDVHVGSAIVKVKTPPTFSVKPGDALSLDVDLARVHLFDAGTQAALL